MKKIISATMAKLNARHKTLSAVLPALHTQSENDSFFDG